MNFRFPTLDKSKRGPFYLALWFRGSLAQSVEQLTLINWFGVRVPDDLPDMNPEVLPLRDFLCTLRKRLNQLLSPNQA